MNPLRTYLDLSGSGLNFDWPKVFNLYQHCLIWFQKNINKRIVASAFGNNSDEMAIVTEPNCDEEVRHPVSASDTENGMVEAMAGDVLYSKD